MKRRVRGLTLLVVLSLLTSAATTGAECAWVLWEQRVERPWWRLGGPTLTWYVHSGYITIDKCLPEAESMADSAHAALKTLGGEGMKTRHGNGWTFLVLNTPPHQSVSQLWPLLRTAQCLPDTVDPRGPKGK
jgi:hypothetical protein